MPGIYLLAILISTAGIAAIDVRWKLAAGKSPGRTAAAVAIGVVFFLAWDAVGIATGVFLKGDSPLYTGVDLAPELPLEELFFLVFLCYLALVVWAAALRVLDSRSGSARSADPVSRTHESRSAEDRSS